MDTEEAALTGFYKAFSARDFEAVGRLAHPEVEFDDQIDGGRRNGREALRRYWERLQGLVKADIAPFAFERQPDGSVIVRSCHHVTSQRNKLWAEGENRMRFVFRDGLIWRMDRA